MTHVQQLIDDFMGHDNHRLVSVATVREFVSKIEAALSAPSVNPDQSGPEQEKGSRVDGERLSGQSLTAASHETLIAIADDLRVAVDTIPCAAGAQLIGRFARISDRLDVALTVDEPRKERCDTCAAWTVNTRDRETGVCGSDAAHWHGAGLNTFARWGCRDWRKRPDSSMESK